MLDLKPKGRSRDRPIPSIGEETEKPLPEEILPQTLQPLDTDERLEPFLKVFVREIKVTGNTVFTTKEISRVTDYFVNRELISEDLEELRQALTVLYVQNGYVNSGAVIPDQAVGEEALTIQIIEGQLTSIKVQGNRSFRDSYIEDRIALGAGVPLNIESLQEQLLYLNQDFRIEKINAVLTPGVALGESALEVTVQDQSPFRLWLDYNNYIPPTVGSEEGLLTAAHQNLTGNGDILSATYGRSTGIDPHLELNYSKPVSTYDTILSLYYKKNSYAVVGQAFEPLEIESSSDLIGASLAHPLRRSLTSEVTFGIIGEYIQNKSSLLGVPFSFTPGAEDGESTVTALRVFHDWLSRDQRKVVNLHSQLTLGVDAFGSTNNSSGIPDSQFLSGLFQFQWAQRYRDWGGTETILRSDLQLASEHLLPVEQIAVGGRYSVRGYRENLLVRDNAFITSLEARVPLVRNRSWADYFQIAPFVDAGTSWNTDFPTPEPKTVYSIGLGLRWALTVEGNVPLRPEFEIYKGFPLKNVDVPDDDVQDDGIHFRFVVRSF